MLNVNKACCRYCCNCIDGDGIICTVKNHSVSEQYAKSYHKCNDFEFNEIDVFNSNNKYTEREKIAPDENQISLF